MADDYIPEVLVYDDKQKQADNVKTLLEDDFNVYTATPATLSSVIRSTTDVIVTDLEIIIQEDGITKAERMGNDDIEEILKKLGFVKPVIIYSTVTDFSKIKNSSKGNLLFDYVVMSGYEWSEELIEKILRAYADRVRQKGKMFEHWFTLHDIIDEQITSEGMEKLRSFDYSVQDNLTYRMLIGWFKQEENVDETEADVFSEVLFSRLHGESGFLNPE